MAIRHGKDTVVKVNAVNLSAYSNMTDWGDETDTHDVTCYGATRKAYGGGLGDGKVTLSGVYDSAVGGPSGTLLPLKAAGAAVPFIYQPEGTGTGKAQRSVNVIIKSYKESAPVADYIKWSCEMQMTGALDLTPQA